MDEKRYLNWQGETIDEIDSTHFENFRAYTKEKRLLLAEYAMSGMAGAYWSQRPIK